MLIRDEPKGISYRRSKLSRHQGELGNGKSSVAPAEDLPAERLHNEKKVPEVEWGHMG